MNKQPGILIPNGQQGSHEQDTPSLDLQDSFENTDFRADVSKMKCSSNCTFLNIRNSNAENPSLGRQTYIPLSKKHLLGKHETHCSVENGLKDTNTSSGKIYGKIPRKKWGPERQCMATISETDPTETV